MDFSKIQLSNGDIKSVGESYKVVVGKTVKDLKLLAIALSTENPVPFVRLSFGKNHKTEEKVQLYPLSSINFLEEVQLTETVEPDPMG